TTTSCSSWTTARSSSRARRSSCSTRPDLFLRAWSMKRARRMRPYCDGWPKRPTRPSGAGRSSQC
ncbi:hypothetical protein GGF31_002777, partial [Allomyces arbusculus]